MPRWLVAVFAVLVLCCAGLPPSAQVMDAALAQADPAPHAVVAEASPDAAAGEGPTQAPGLTLQEHVQDDVPLDVPDLVDSLRHAAPQGMAGATRPAVHSAALPPPVLEGPQRPPRLAGPRA